MRIHWIVYAVAWTAAYLLSIVLVTISTGMDIQFGLNCFVGLIFVAGLWGYALSKCFGRRHFWRIAAAIIVASLLLDLSNLYQLWTADPNNLGRFELFEIADGGMTIINPILDLLLALPGYWALFQYPYDNSIWSSKP